jgi:hypothetical protein
MTEIVDSEGKLVAIVIASEYKNNGIEFFTPGDFSQQLACMCHPKDKIIPPHKHKIHTRQVHLTQEVLLLRSGKVKTDLYDEDDSYIASVVLNTGDVIMLVSGGHSFTMLEPSELIEVKQGPYMGDLDKVSLTPKKGSV